MNKAHPDLDQMQSEYKAAVNEWIDAIRREETLASANHSLAEVDKWEQAHFEEEAARDRVKTAKRAYEAALRSEFFGI